ncbi:Excinuclease ABC C subunit domain protein [Thermobaculum terrenum ATCC BAA-798]|uniref:Excinuclease ABC C subunit domain protein n=1 Tax=Thermobaculum terrenum (strain ATCC BAA-798 / CCMEE 7001 / YNP1) TaxID=525904 RepID=D1CBV8_THET1|nr:GIY-YIG nuclease family protein [Thermobaculum terrenum]ACZ42273.1 Excinuclease ABC C subunit domain protein [Thermobaculum terrenum ATCC BAA-798]
MDSQDKIRSRAVALLKNGPMSEDSLARELFGAINSGPAWIRILEQCLDGDPRLEKDPIGVWRIKEDAISRQPVLLTGRTTRANRGRLLLLAIYALEEPTIRYWRFSVNSKVPLYQEGLYDWFADIEPVPFEHVAKDISHYLVGRNVYVLDIKVWNSLAHEFSRIGLSPDLAEPVVVSSKGWDRDKSNYLLKGLSPGPFSNSNPLAKEIQMILSAIKDSYTHHAAQDVSYRLRHMQEKVRAVPEWPGVYIFYDSYGTPMYVGSSSNLRSRLRTYLAGQVDITRNMKGFLENVSDFEYVLLATHLEAQIEEMALISRLNPKYNIQKMRTRKLWWLRIEKKDNIKLAVVSDNRKEGAFHLGPLPNRKLLYDLKIVVQSALTLCPSMLPEEPEGLAQVVQDPEKLQPIISRLIYITGVDSKRSLERSSMTRVLQKIENGQFSLMPGRFQGPAIIISYCRLSRELLFTGVVNIPTVSARARWDDIEDVRKKIKELLILLDSCQELTNVPTYALSITTEWLYEHRFDTRICFLPITVEEVISRVQQLVEEQCDSLQSPL